MNMALPKGLGLPVEKPIRVTIIHPLTNMPAVNKHTGEEAWVELYSTDSPIVKERARDITLARINAAQASSYRRKLATKKDLDKAEADALDTLAALTHDWSLVGVFGDHDGEPIEDFPCTPENARDLYADPTMTWLREFVDTESANRANFAKDSSTN
jgi:hypothetical protein